MRTPKQTTTSSQRRGAVLFEVVLALVLFAGAAAIIGGGLHTAVGSVERLRLNAHAVDLAVSVLSELQMGSKSAAPGGPQPFEPPFEAWTWEVLSAPTGDFLDTPSPLQTVEVMIRCEEPPMVFRLSQMMRLDSGSRGTFETTSTPDLSVP